METYILQLEIAVIENKTVTNQFPKGKFTKIFSFILLLNNLDLDLAI